MNVRASHTLRTVAVVALAVAVPSGIAIAAIESGDESVAVVAKRQAVPAPTVSAGAAKLSVLSAAPAAENPLGDAAEYTSFADTTRAQVVPAWGRNRP